MKIILIGYMGSGKSTLGKLLSEYFKISFIDLDNYIEQKENASVSEIFKEKGEIYFRKKEIFFLQELLKSEENFVLSTGGGTPCFGENIKLMTQNAQVIYLKYQPNSLKIRLLAQKENRPLISHLNETDLEEFIRKHLFDRNPYYLQAQTIIAMDNLSVAESFELLLSKISI